MRCVKPAWRPRWKSAVPVAAAFAVMAVNATGAILKFIGFVIFLAVGLGAALALSGAVI